jgi:hypothetical protein
MRLQEFTTRNVTLTIPGIVAIDLALFFQGGLANRQPLATDVTPALVMGPIVIAVCVAAQLWMRDKPKYRLLSLLAYALTHACAPSETHGRDQRERPRSGLNRAPLSLVACVLIKPSPGRGGLGRSHECGRCQVPSASEGDGPQGRYVGFTRHVGPLSQTSFTQACCRELSSTASRISICRSPSTKVGYSTGALRSATVR